MNMQRESALSLPGARVPHSSTPVITLREFLVTFFKDRRRIALGFFIPLILAIVVSFIPKPRYEATSTILIRMGREYLYKPEVGEQTALPTSSIDRDQAMHSEVEILNSRDLVESVIDAMGLEKLYPSIAAADEDPDLPRKSRAIIEMQKRMDVLLLKDSNVIQISFKHPDPRVAAEVVNRLVDGYLEKRRTIFADAKIAFVQGQVKSFRDRLSEIERKIERFKTENSIVIFSDQVSTLLEQKAGLETKLKEISASLAQTKSKITAIERSMNGKGQRGAYSEASSDDAVNAAKKALVDLRLKESEASGKYLDASPIVQDLRASIDRTERYIREMETQRAAAARAGQGVIKDAWETQILTLKVEEESDFAAQRILTEQLSKVSARLAGLNRQDRELAGMLREQKLLEEGYQTYSKKLEDARITDELDHKEKTSVSIVQAALPPIEKKSLQLVILAVGFVFSICSALVIAFLSELLRDTFISPEKLVRSLGLPVLASISLKN
jgi:uncharacterized protein involved in exopolysaccharide biosynthesis